MPRTRKMSQRQANKTRRDANAVCIIGRGDRAHRGSLTISSLFQKTTVERPLGPQRDTGRPLTPVQDLQTLTEHPGALFSVLWFFLSGERPPHDGSPSCEMVS